MKVSSQNRDQPEVRLCFGTFEGSVLRSNAILASSPGSFYPRIFSY